MCADQSPSSARRADAERNRDKILVTARTAFAASDAELSMAEISRRAGVGMATLYRNFPSRQALLETLYQEEVEAICQAAETVTGETPGQELISWLRRFAAFLSSKHSIAAELLKHTDTSDPVFGSSRARVLTAAQPLLTAAQRTHAIRGDLTLEQIIDLIVAITRIRGDTQYFAPILQTVLDGLRPSPS